MSLLLESNLFEDSIDHNQFGNFEITGWEIIPFIPREECIVSKEQEVRLRNEVSKFVKQVVNQSLAEMKAKYSDEQRTRTTSSVIQAIPASFHVPTDCDHLKTTYLDTFLSQKKTRNPTSLAGETSISFALLKDYIFDDPEINQLLSKYTCQSSFSDRLRGWKIERRQRVVGTYDLYFKHERLRTTLRSYVEVAKFLLYEEIPQKMNQLNKVSENDSSDQRRSSLPPLKRKSTSPILNPKLYNRRSSLTPLKRKSTSLISNPKLYDDSKESVHNFNFSHKTDGEVGVKKVIENVLMGTRNKSFPEYSANKSSSQSDAADTRADKEKACLIVEDFLATSYNNLLNYFN